MPTRLAIIGLDLHQRPWLEAVESLHAGGTIELVAVGQRTLAAARDVAAIFKNLSAAPPVYDDLRQLMNERSPEVILLDRPPNASLEFLLQCLSQGVGILSLGPPVESPAEAQALAGALPPQTHLLRIWPGLSDHPAFRHGAHSHDFILPLRFASASFFGVNAAIARGVRTDTTVRSLGILAWESLAALIELMGLPTAVYASFRGAAGSGNSFSDFSGAAALALRFADAAAGVTLCDRIALESAPSREMTLWGQGGVMRMGDAGYEFRDGEAKLIETGKIDPAELSPRKSALAALQSFLEQFQMPASSHRGWPHRIDEVAAAMEAMLVSHRTGQAEFPEKFLRLRR